MAFATKPPPGIPTKHTDKYKVTMTYEIIDMLLFGMNPNRARLTRISDEPGRCIVSFVIQDPSIDTGRFEGEELPERQFTEEGLLQMIENIHGYIDRTFHQ